MMIHVSHIVAVAIMICAAGGADAQSAKDVEGTWTLVSSVNEMDGKKTDQFGPDPKGMLNLSADGHFMLTIIGTGLPKFTSNNRANGTAEENKAVLSRSIAMIGSYVINSEAKELILKTDRSTFPNWDATEQKRLIATFNAQELKYVTPSASGGGVGTVTWKRAK